MFFYSLRGALCSMRSLAAKGCKSQNIIGEKAEYNSLQVDNIKSDLR